ncbi:MAG TPA: hypothetical protein VEQ42_04365 [Pyrinomonadaceae bacterium]|nr:hypothetical protein [Pyrinomonadaceae bacterium]
MAENKVPNEEPAWASNLVSAINFMNTYPSSGSTELSSPAPASSPATTSLQQLVMQAIQGVLGRSFKPGDYGSFKAALEVSFEYKEVEGRATYQWKPRAYPSTGASVGGGGVSGAQYSLVSFASALYERTLPLIDSLRSLVPDTDEEELEAARAILRTTWTEFVSELSRETGPRAPRANELSRSIFDTATGRGHHVRFGRLLGTLLADSEDRRAARLNSTTGRPVFTRRFVVTTEEEGTLTNFIALSDYIFAVDQSWDNYRTNFFQTDLGTGLLTLERQLAVVEESVNELYSAMDSVNIDQAERLAIHINFTGPYKDVSIEDFLSWIVSFATSEAPQLIRDGGKWGVEAILPTARTLRTLTDQFITQVSNTYAGQSFDADADADMTTALRGGRAASKRAAARASAPEQDDSREPPEPLPSERESVRRLPAALNHPRVINPLSEVALYLNEVVVTAQRITN